MTEETVISFSLFVISSSTHLLLITASFPSLISSLPPPLSPSPPLPPPMGVSFSVVDESLQKHLQSKDFEALRKDLSGMAQISESSLHAEEDHKAFHNILSSVLSSKDIIMNHPDIGTVCLESCVVHMHHKKFAAFYKSIDSFRPIITAILAMFKMITEGYSGLDVQQQLAFPGTQLGLMEPALSIVLLAMEESKHSRREWISAALPILSVGSVLLDPPQPISPNKKYLGNAIGIQLEAIKKMLALADTAAKGVDNESRQEIKNFDEGKYWTSLTHLTAEGNLNTNKAIGVVKSISEGKQVDLGGIWAGRENEQKATAAKIKSDHDKRVAAKDASDEASERDHARYEEKMKGYNTSLERLRGGGVMAAYEAAKIKAFGVD